MSNKLSTSDIIQKGDYLSLTFDPTSLTVAHLIGIFQYHGIRYPTPHNKAKLVDLFNKEIKSKSLLLQRDRAKMSGMEASDDGIIDGVSGLPLSRNNAPEKSSSVCNLIAFIFYR